MKKNTKKQLNKKKKSITSKKRRNVLLAPKKRVVKKLSAKLVKTNKKTKKQIKSKTKSALKNRQVAVLKQKTKKVIRKICIKKEKQNNHILTFGDIDPERGKILLLVVAIVFVFSFLVAQNFSKEKKIDTQSQVAIVKINKNAAREKEINDLVVGYPIEKMTKYIAKQDPKVAAFLIAIAKKESAWGDRSPVLNGEDCYNYWGFRLKSDRMGSGGHTCFDSPEEAVAIVGARISQLVNEEQIDTPNKMIVWKCGYGCNGPEAAGSQKWIKDVEFYYNKVIN